MQRLYVPTINANPSDFDYLFQLRNNLDAGIPEVTFDFSSCSFLQQNAVAFLGGLARLIYRRSGTAVFDWNSMKGKVLQNLERNGFVAAFGGRTYALPGNAIPYREDSELNKRELMPYLEREWLGSGKGVTLSQALRAEIVGKVVEIYVNAFEHGASPIGVISCGQHYPNLKETKLTVIDFGVGIPTTVRQYLKRPRMPSANALEWAFQTGNTTKTGAGIGRGMGLGLLESFIRANHGHLEIFSHDGYVLIDEHQRLFTKRQSSFEGTLVNISLQCDERYYCLSSEISDEPLF